MRFAITFTDMTEQEVEAPSMLTKRESFHYAIDEAVKTCVQLHKEIDSIELVEK